jgi:hypothetical protein
MSRDSNTSSSLDERDELLVRAEALGEDTLTELQLSSPIHQKLYQLPVALVLKPLASALPRQKGLASAYRSVTP